MKIHLPFVICINQACNKKIEQYRKERIKRDKQKVGLNEKIIFL
jgi:electron transfer flavoprotein alpha/beta subunit